MSKKRGLPSLLGKRSADSEASRAAVSLEVTPYERFLELYVGEEYAEALVAFDLIPIAHPSYRDAHYFEGVAHIKLKHWGEAIQSFQFISTTHPNYFKAIEFIKTTVLDQALMELLGKSYINSECYVNCEISRKLVLKHLDVMSFTNTLKTIVLDQAISELGSEGFAIAAFIKHFDAVSFTNSDFKGSDGATLLLKCAEECLRYNMYEAAAIVFEKSLELLPTGDFPDYCAAGDAYYGSGNWSKAIKWYETALDEIAAGSAFQLYQLPNKLVRAYFKLGNVKKAIESAQKLYALQNEIDRYDDEDAAPHTVKKTMTVLLQFAVSMLPDNSPAASAKLLSKMAALAPSDTSLGVAKLASVDSLMHLKLTALMAIDSSDVAKSNIPTAQKLSGEALVPMKLLFEAVAKAFNSKPFMEQCEILREELVCLGRKSPSIKSKLQKIAGEVAGIQLAAKIATGEVDKLIEFIVPKAFMKLFVSPECAHVLKGSDSDGLPLLMLEAPVDGSGSTDVAVAGEWPTVD